MKADAIVYTSNTGFTQRYAQMLGRALELPVHDLAQARAALPGGASVVYLGWLMAGSMKGLRKAAARYRLAAICPVGMGPDDGKQAEDLRGKAGLTAATPIFYLRGGYAPQRLGGLYKPMMSAMGSVIKKAAATGGADGDPEAGEMLQAFTQGADWVKEENLAPVIEYIK